MAKKELTAADLLEPGDQMSVYALSWRGVELNSGGEYLGMGRVIETGDTKRESSSQEHVRPGTLRVEVGDPKQILACSEPVGSERDLVEAGVAGNTMNSSASRSGKKRKQRKCDDEGGEGDSNANFDTRGRDSQTKKAPPSNIMAKKKQKDDCGLDYPNDLGGLSFGKGCHRCRRKSEFLKMRCSGRADEKHCELYFCENCLKQWCVSCSSSRDVATHDIWSRAVLTISLRHPQVIFNELDQEFDCPKCAGNCSCYVCTKERSFEAQRSSNVRSVARASTPKKVREQ